MGTTKAEAVKEQYGRLNTIGKEMIYRIAKLRSNNRSEVGKYNY